MIFCMIPRVHLPYSCFTNFYTERMIYFVSKRSQEWVAWLVKFSTGVSVFFYCLKLADLPLIFSLYLK